MVYRFNRNATKPKSLLGYCLILALFAGLAFLYVKKEGSLQTASSAGKMSRDEVEVIIKDYLMENPKIIFDAMEKFYVEKSQHDRENAKNTIQSKTKELEEDASDPRAGAANGKIKIVEFFDYRCSYCQHMVDVKKKVIDHNPNVQFIFKESPMLSKDSVLAAKAALAVNKINKAKYLAFQTELLGHRGEITPEAIDGIATKLEINKEQLRKEMADKAIEQKIEQNVNLAHEIGIRGTPAYIIAGEVLPGKVSYETIKQVLDNHK